MSRALRMTHWPHPLMPTMVAMLETDMRVSAEEAVEEMVGAEQGFFTYEIFDVADDDLPAATVAAAQRAAEAESDERNMAIAYQWYVRTLQTLKPGGVCIGTEPAPLTREQMAWVLRFVARHSTYERQSFNIPLIDGTTIQMKEGEVLPA